MEGLYPYPSTYSTSEHVFPQDKTRNVDNLLLKTQASVCTEVPSGTFTWPL